MPEFQEKKLLREFFASRPVMLALFFLMMFIGFSTFRALVQGWEAAEEQQDVERRIQNLEEKKSALSSEVENLRTNTGVELEAREKLNLRRPGEKVVVIIDREGDSSKEADTGQKSIWTKVKAAVFGIFNLYEDEK